MDPEYKSARDGGTAHALYRAVQLAAVAMSVDNALYLLDPSQPLPLSTRLDAISRIENALVGCVDSGGLSDDTGGSILSVLVPAPFALRR